MTLSSLIRGNAPHNFATATLATPATRGLESGGTVAKVAGVAVANAANDEPPYRLWWVGYQDGRAAEFDSPSGLTREEVIALALRDGPIASVEPVWPLRSTTPTASQPSQSRFVRCADCSHAEKFDHPVLVRCGAGRMAPGACGAWWSTNSHSCGEFASMTSTLETATP